MDKKCRVWKSNSYNLDNIISKEVFKERVLKIVEALLVSEDTFHSIHSDKISKHADSYNIVYFPEALELEEFIAVDHILTSNELFLVNKIVYGGNNYNVTVNIEREVQTKSHFITSVSSCRKIVIKVSSNNNNDSIEYLFKVPYVYENHKALVRNINYAYDTLVNLYKDYGH